MAEREVEIIPRPGSLQTVNADDVVDGADFLDCFFGGMKVGISPTCSSPSVGVSEFTNRLTTRDFPIPELVTMSNVRPPGSMGEFL